jgi:hypothetical protein
MLSWILSLSNLSPPIWISLRMLSYLNIVAYINLLQFFNIKWKSIRYSCRKSSFSLRFYTLILDHDALFICFFMNNMIIFSLKIIFMNLIRLSVKTRAITWASSCVRVNLTQLRSRRRKNRVIMSTFQTIVLRYNRLTLHAGWTCKISSS